jgi:hypothetical protein
MKRILVFSLINLCITGWSQKPARVALVIGVRDYEFVQPLKNTLNDARDMATTLKAKGFQVIELYNPKTKRELQDAIKNYYNKLIAQRETVGLVFYSGHGMQVDGINYMMPTSANPEIKADLDDQAVKMEYMLNAVEQAGNTLNIFILDACRNNPFRSFSRSSDPGLLQVNAPKGSYVVYATSPGSVASDGLGNNGLFTSKLLKYINQPNINIEQVFKYVARDVQQESEGMQVPWINYSYFGDFFFNSDNTSQTVVNSVSQQDNLNSRAGTSIPDASGYFLGKMAEEKGARLETPSQSPRSIISSDLGFMKVSIDYSRILRRDRKIFGEGSDFLVPYGKIWRTGVNVGTRVYFSTDVYVGQSLVPKGAYAIYSKPGADAWNVMLYKDLTLGGNINAYDEKQEAVR